MDVHYDCIDDIVQLMSDEFSLMHDCNINNCISVRRHYQNAGRRSIRFSQNNLSIYTNKPLLNALNKSILKMIKMEEYSSITDCDQEQLLQLLESTEILDDKVVSPWKKEIIGYIKMNGINCKTLFDHV